MILEHIAAWQGAERGLRFGVWTSARQIVQARTRLLYET